MMAEVNTDLSSGAAAKSPLIKGDDIRSIKPADLAILSNVDIIAENQDLSGSSAARRCSTTLTPQTPTSSPPSKCGPATECSDYGDGGSAWGEGV
jgi:hypothetical protein